MYSHEEFSFDEARKVSDGPCPALSAIMVLEEYSLASYVNIYSSFSIFKSMF